MSDKVFTTPTGQTGLDAYIFETTAIANAQRELDERFKRLVAAVRKEQPELFTNSTDFLYAESDAAEHFWWYVRGREKEFFAKR